MAIDLKNVNISLDEFQRISSGWYNAGEVKLKNANTLDKVNNHVATWWYDNKDEISHAETVAIKEALVKALSQHGVEGEALNRARQKLGLQPMDPSDKSLLKRSVMPLTRQQIREILDENAATLNQSEGHERIRTQAELDARKGDRALEKSTAKRNEINASLASRDEFRVNTEIARFERVVSDFADFNSLEERAQLLEVAKKQLNALMVDCHCRPRADHRAIAKCEIEGGQQVTIDTGLSEVEFAERLENFIARLCGGVSGPKADELEVVSRYRACKSRAEQQDFLNALPTEQEFGFKARALAVRCLYSRKVTDYATLSVVNRISDANAYALARSLLDMPGDATPEQLRANPLLVQLMAAAPVKVKNIEQAYIPATSTAQFNNFVLDSFQNRPQNLLPRYRDLAISVQNEVRDRLGEVAMPNNLDITNIHDNVILAGLYSRDSAVWEARRNTPDNLRESYLASALRKGATRIVEAELVRVSPMLRDNPVDVGAVLNGLRKRYPLFFRHLAEAENPAVAKAIVGEFREKIERQTRLYCTAKPIAADILARMKRTLAAKLNVEPGVFPDEEFGILHKITTDRTELFEKILTGEVQANTEEEIAAAFQELVDGEVAKLTECLQQVGNLNPPLPPQVADHVKLMIFTLEKFDNLNVQSIADKVRKRIDTTHLEDLLKGNGSVLQIQQEMKNICMTIRGISREEVVGRPDADKCEKILSIVMTMVLRGNPGLADKIDAFFLRPDVRPEFELLPAMRTEESLSMDLFRMFSFHPGVLSYGPENAAKVRAYFSAPREMAAFKAAGGEVAALQAGYHAKDMPMLARAFVLVKAAKVVDDETALKDVLKPDSQSRLLFSYGGRFIESPENFRRGLLLMAKFRDWRAAQYDAYVAGRRDTPTLLNAEQGILASRVGLERFVLEEIGSNPAFDLDEENGEKLFGVANNKAMRLIGLGYGSSSYGTMMGLAAEKRAFICDVLDIFNCPLPQTQADKEAWTELKFPSIFLARVLKHWDELEELREEGHFDRAHIMPILYGDLGLPQGATNADINQGFDDRLMPLDFGVSMNIQFMMNASGDTFDACREAHEQGHWLPNAPGIVGFSPDLDGVNGTADARATMTGDLNRAANPGLLPDRIPILQAADVRYLFHFPGNQTLASKFGFENDPEVAAASNAIADKLERLCGKVHEKQLAAVYYALSQSAASALKGAFIARGVASDEHMALTHTISRDNATGTVTIVTSQPEGLKDRDNLPLNFHWTTTVAVDGKVTTTPLVVEPPPQPQPVANP